MRTAPRLAVASFTAGIFPLAIFLRTRQLGHAEQLGDAGDRLVRGLRSTHELLC